MQPETPEDIKQGLEEQKKALQKLKRIADSQEFKDYFDNLIAGVAYKMLWAFMSSKGADNVASYDDFCRVRGEIIATLAVIMEVNGAGPMVDAVKKQLDENYKQPV